MAISSHTWAVGEVVTAANMNTYLRDNVADLDSRLLIAATGTYTGDGTTGQAITGVGVAPIFAQVWEEEANGNAVNVYFTTETYLALGTGLSVEMGSGGLIKSLDDRIIAFGSDGFTVADSGNDQDPNKDGQVYHYAVWGLA